MKTGEPQGGLSPAERWTYRAMLTVTALAVSALLLPVLILLKVVEGFYFVGKVAIDAVRQAWSTPSEK